MKKWLRINAIILTTLTVVNVGILLSIAIVGFKFRQIEGYSPVIKSLQEGLIRIDSENAALAIQLGKFNSSADNLADLESLDTDLSIETMPIQINSSENSFNEVNQIDEGEAAILIREFSIAVEEYYLDFINSLSIDEETQANIFEELSLEFQNLIESSNTSEDQSMEVTFQSAQPGEGIRYLPSKVFRKYLSDDDLIRFTSYQSMLARNEYDVFTYFEQVISNYQSQNHGVNDHFQ